MIAAACLTLAGVHVLVWARQQAARGNLLFSLSAAATAAMAGCELWMMRAQTPEEFGAAVRWMHVPVWVMILSLVGFVRVYLRAGRPWLAWTVSGVRTLSLAVNFIVTPNLNYREITGLRHVWFLGESVAVAEGVPSSWMLVGQASLVLLVVFVVDAAIAVWRRGHRRQAMLIGFSMVFFVLAATGQAILTLWGIVHVPLTPSLFFMGIVAGMAYELSDDLLRAAKLSHDLSESEQRMKLAADAAGLGLWVWEIPRDEICISNPGRALFGLEEGERLDFARFTATLHPEDRELVRAGVAAAFAKGGNYRVEYRVVSGDAPPRWIAARGHVERAGDGKPLRMRGVSIDITERKQAEQETLLLRQEIAHVGRVSMMGQLASALAHEINQPLGAILRNAEAAELFMQNESPDLDEVRAILVDIRKDDQRAGAVIDRMRSLLKRHDLDTRTLDVSELVGDVAGLVRADAAVRQVRLHVDVVGDLPQVRGDRVHLQQVLLNLIINAMDAVNEAEQENRRVTVSARFDGAQTIEIAVCDSGPGIPAGQLAHVFDPFFTTKSSGMGMGLPISRTIIEVHGGDLWAENNNGCGATFRFTLPVGEERSR